MNRDYPSIDDWRRAIPGLIVENNLYGIATDLRTIQLTVLELWLLCHRAGCSQPQCSNVVFVSPLPRDAVRLPEFLVQLHPRALKVIVEGLTERMALASNLGSLMRIEEDAEELAVTANREYLAPTSRKSQLRLLEVPEQDESSFQPTLFELHKKQMVSRERRGLGTPDATREELWVDAHERILAALKTYTGDSCAKDAWLRDTFAQQLADGLDFIRLSRNRYDVLLANPPIKCQEDRRAAEYLRGVYRDGGEEPSCLFVQRQMQLGTPDCLYGTVGQTPSTIQPQDSCHWFAEHANAEIIAKLEHVDGKEYQAKLIVGSNIRPGWRQKRTPIFTDIASCEAKDEEHQVADEVIRNAGHPQPASGSRPTRERADPYHDATQNGTASNPYSSAVGDGCSGSTTVSEPAQTLADPCPLVPDGRGESKENSQNINSLFSNDELESIRKAIREEILATRRLKKKDGWLDIDGVEHLPNVLGGFVYRLALSAPVHFQSDQAVLFRVTGDTVRGVVLQCDEDSIVVQCEAPLPLMHDCFILISIRASFLRHLNSSCSP